MNPSLLNLPLEFLWEIVDHVAEQEKRRMASSLFQFPTSKPVMAMAEHPIEGV